MNIDAKNTTYRYFLLFLLSNIGKGCCLGRREVNFLEPLIKFGPFNQIRSLTLSKKVDNLKLLLKYGNSGDLRVL